RAGLGHQSEPAALPQRARHRARRADRGRRAAAVRRAGGGQGRLAAGGGHACARPGDRAGAQRRRTVELVLTVDVLGRMTQPPAGAMIDGMTAFRFGTVAGQAPDLKTWTALARRAEELGYDTLVSPDPQSGLDPFTTLAAAAAVTTTLHIGTFVA